MNQKLGGVFEGGAGDSMDEGVQIQPPTWI